MAADKGDRHRDGRDHGEQDEQAPAHQCAAVKTVLTMVGARPARRAPTTPARASVLPLPAW
jgi:hypothetical protein